MKKRSLQRIQDFYENQGYSGEKLRQKLLKDREYQQILKTRKQKLTKTVKVNKKEQKKYVLSTDEDYEILSLVKDLEKHKLNKEDLFVARFIRTQLERDWRKPLIKKLREIKKKY